MAFTRSTMTPTAGSSRRRRRRRSFISRYKPVRRSREYRNEKQHDGSSSSSSFHSIPRELITELLARVASSSSTDFFNAKLSCKFFNEAVDEEYVFKHISLEKFPLDPWRTDERVNSFLQRCKKSGNPESLYRQGVVDYFSYSREESGLELLREAINSGHLAASYALGIVMLFHDGGESKEMGIKLVGGMKKSMATRRKTRECREKLEAIVKNIWVRNSSILQRLPICCKLRDQHMMMKTTTSTTWLSSESAEEEDDDDLKCEGCLCDEEVTSFARCLPRTYY